MQAIFRVDEHDVPWAEYGEAVGNDGSVPIRYKALTVDHPEVPPVQYVEYAPGHADPMHRHRTGEVLVVTDGELWLEGVRSGPGSIVFVPPEFDYSVSSGKGGVRFFRVVVQ